MIPGKFVPRFAAVAAVLAALMSGLFQTHVLGHSPVVNGSEEFSPLFARRLDVGIGRLDGPAGHVTVAHLGLYYSDPLGTPASANPLSGCLGSGCLGSVCFGSLCMGSKCLGSACISSGCLGSGCTGSGCAGSACIDSRCVGSACIQSGCLGSACLSCGDSTSGGGEMEG